MVRLFRLEVLIFAGFAVTACGDGTRFGGEQTRRDSRLGKENAATDPSLDQTQADGSGEGSGDSGEVDGDGTADGGTGDGDGTGDGAEGTDGPGADGESDGTIDVPATTSLYWHWPCAAKPGAPTPNDPAAMVITGKGDYMLEPRPVNLEIGGEACDPGSGPRDVLFVVDVSDSMRNFLNLGNDPVRDGTCGRAEGVKAVLASLGEDSRVALVTFDGDPQTVSNGYLTVAEFSNLYANTAVLCESGANTNFTKALAQAQLLLAMGRADAARELYFLSDGEPNSETVDGHLEAAEIKKTATIATVMLRGDEDYMRDVLASRDASNQPLHAKVEAAADLATALALLADLELTEASVRYGAIGDEANWKLENLDFPANLAFDVAPWTLTQAAWPQGFGFTANTVDSKGNKTETSGKLLWKP